MKRHMNARQISRMKKNTVTFPHAKNTAILLEMLMAKGIGCRIDAAGVTIGYDGKTMDEKRARSVIGELLEIWKQEKRSRKGSGR